MLDLIENALILDRNFFAYLVIINLIGFFSMWNDKRLSKKENTWRTPEKTLLLIALFGGSIGSYIGMNTFRHKTKHPKFYIGIPLIFILQVVLLVLIRTGYYKVILEYIVNYIKDTIGISDESAYNKII